MSIRSSRSKSPFVMETSEKQLLESGNRVGQTVFRTTRSATKITTKSVSNEHAGQVDSISVSEEDSAGKMKNLKLEKGVRKSTRYKTSDYSSEDGDHEVTSTHVSMQNDQNQLYEDLRRSASRSSGSGGSQISALDVYRAAGDYWNKYPKTDYTYSSHSKDRTEIIPGVYAMPNMSRRSLHTYDSGDYFSSKNKQTDTNSFLSDEENYSSKTDYQPTLTSSADNGARLLPRSLFANNYESKYVASRATTVKKKNIVWSIFSTITSVFVTIFMPIASFVRYVNAKQNSWFVWLAKLIHTITSQVMLVDTWLLRARYSRGILNGSRKRLLRILMLCLLPLVVFGGWWLLSGLGGSLYAAYFNTSATSLPTAPLVVPSIGKKALEEKIVTVKESIIVEPSGAGKIVASLTAEQLEIIAALIQNAQSQQEQYTNEYILEHVLQSAAIKNIVNNYDELNAKFEENVYQTTTSEIGVVEQTILIKNLKEEINKIKLELVAMEKTRADEISQVIAKFRSENLENNFRVMQELRRCCRKSFIHIESHVANILKDLLGAPAYLTSQKDISQWLHSVFVAKHDLEARLANLTDNLKTDFDFLVESNGKMLMDEITTKIVRELNDRIANVRRNSAVTGEVSLDSLTDEHIKRIVNDVLAVYDADKTGLVDYAMEPSGGQIISTRCTEGFQARSAVVSLFGVPLWYPSTSPRTVITPGVVPGDCWAFQNFPGFVVVKLSTRVKVNAFSLEHISKSLVPNGKIDSAPKEFAVYGLRNETDKDPIKLGQYFYDYYGPPLQYFAAENHGLVFDIVELRVLSNHGNPNYTCLYRFRVHGTLSSEPT